MLAVKSTCKDRLRQVLAEADKIDDKHLLTLEPRISANQTSEMQAKRLQLVVPRPLHETYNADQRAWLFDIRAFTELALSRRSEEHTSELQSLMRISYAVFCLKQNINR